MHPTYCSSPITAVFCQNVERQQSLHGYLKEVMGQISEQWLLEAVQVNIDVSTDGLEGSMLHLGDL